MQFLDAFSHLYQRVCPSIHPSVRGSVPHVEKPPRGPAIGQYWLLFDEKASQQSRRRTRRHRFRWLQVPTMCKPLSLSLSRLAILFIWAAPLCMCMCVCVCVCVFSSPWSSRSLANFGVWKGSRDVLSFILFITVQWSKTSIFQDFGWTYRRTYEDACKNALWRDGRMEGRIQKRPDVQ